MTNQLAVAIAEAIRSPMRVNKIHKEVYGFDQAREFNDKDRRKLLRLLSSPKHPSKEKTLRSHREGFFVPEVPEPSPSLNDIYYELFKSFDEESN